MHLSNGTFGQEPKKLPDVQIGYVPQVWSGGGKTAVANMVAHQWNTASSGMISANQ